ncbi:GlsB/YeaQ/YmgE family stress response membrane protein [Stappia stellulata]|uniref:GlsB/YeaQ/YmgE family stress response membrane protein n=1 Tax=Stappia stellulata TaxID=71235 RepID=UPI001CD5B19D|nr:GlsB/YeaQ/YmgE family stress response membrane protein [Stappia stellulata]MCA1241803.1 GlsB/YeaQ/YmgE family stress response membrane protein [Stappia stellulata]
MEIENILIWCVIGLIAGWLASLVLGGGGLIRYLISGLIGAFVGGFLFNLLGIDINLGNAIVNQIVVATVGAIVVVFVARRIT